MEVNHRKGFQYTEEADEKTTIQGQEKDEELVGSDQEEERKKDAIYEENFDYDAKKKEDNKEDFLEHIADSLFRAFVIAAVIKIILYIYHRYFDPEVFPTVPSAEDHSLN